MRETILEQFALKNKRILITGASSGIGRQVAIHVAALGGKVYITGRNREKLQQTFDLLTGDEHQLFVADLTVENDVLRLTESIDYKLDGIVHSAGIIHLFLAKYLNKTEIEQGFNINYYAPIQLMTNLFKAKKINKNCSTVFISSFSAKFPYPSGSLYTGSKAALENYAKCLAVENAGSGFRANSVLPALIKTGMYESTVNSIVSENMEGRVKRYENYYLRGIGNPEDVANMITFLLSDASKWITGQSFIIDGGYLLGLTSKMLE